MGAASHVAMASLGGGSGATHGARSLSFTDAMLNADDFVRRSNSMRSGVDNLNLLTLLKLHCCCCCYTRRARNMCDVSCNRRISAWVCSCFSIAFV